jgi:hypothetical protein
VDNWRRKLQYCWNLRWLHNEVREADRSSVHRSVTQGRLNHVVQSASMAKPVNGGL